MSGVTLGWALASAFLAQSVVSPSQPTQLTARQVIERIQKNVGVPWREQTVDTFKAGNPDSAVTGVVTTMMATYDVLERAARAGKNLIITHEPTFFGHFDRTEEIEKEGDAILAAKQALIKKHNLIVWRFHDHWHLRRPDGILTGMIHALGWEKFKNPADERVLVIPQTTLTDLASRIKKRLGIRTMRVVGDPKLKVSKIGMAPGAGGFGSHRKLLQRDDVEVLVYGEAPEWETVLYGDDAATAKMRKALIILGHIPSEQAGMEECARWLKGFVSEVPIEFIAAKEPFWSPK